MLITLLKTFLVLCFSAFLIIKRYVINTKMIVNNFFYGKILHYFKFLYKNYYYALFGFYFKTNFLFNF